MTASSDDTTRISVHVTSHERLVDLIISARERAFTAYSDDLATLGILLGLAAAVSGAGIAVWATTPAVGKYLVAVVAATIVATTCVIFGVVVFTGLLGKGWSYSVRSAWSTNSECRTMTAVELSAQSADVLRSVCRNYENEAERKRRLCAIALVFPMVETGIVLIVLAVALVVR
jgi:hypothetical protein